MAAKVAGLALKVTFERTSGSWLGDPTPASKKGDHKLHSHNVDVGI